MKYFIQVHPDALKKLSDWLANPNEIPEAWLVDRVRVVNQHQGTWVTISVAHDNFYQIIDNFNHYIIYSQHEV